MSTTDLSELKLNVASLKQSVQRRITNLMTVSQGCSDTFVLIVNMMMTYTDKVKVHNWNLGGSMKAFMSPAFLKSFTPLYSTDSFDCALSNPGEQTVFKFDKFVPELNRRVKSFVCFDQSLNCNPNFEELDLLLAKRTKCLELLRSIPFSNFEKRNEIKSYLSELEYGCRLLIEKNIYEIALLIPIYHSFKDAKDWFYEHSGIEKSILNPFFREMKTKMLNSRETHIKKIEEKKIDDSIRNELSQNWSEHFPVLV